MGRRREPVNKFPGADVRRPLDLFCFKAGLKVGLFAGVGDNRPRFRLHGLLPFVFSEELRYFANGVIIIHQQNSMRSAYLGLSHATPTFLSKYDKYGLVGGRKLFQKIQVLRLSARSIRHTNLQTGGVWWATSQFPAAGARFLIGGCTSAGTRGPESHLSSRFFYLPRRCVPSS